MTDRGKTVYPLQKQQRALNSTKHPKHIPNRHRILHICTLCMLN